MEIAGNNILDKDMEVERKGLGIPATRAGIIENLILKGYIERDKKNLIATHKGISLVTIVSDTFKSAKTTAIWEIKLSDIASGKVAKQVNYKQEILNRIENLESNQIFIANDFFDIAGYETVRSTLNRLVEDRVIIRIMKGIYYKPKYIELIGEYEVPSVNEVANAIARKYNWTIAPSGNTALNLLGLSTQVPAKWTYISDGRYASFSCQFQFRECNN